MAGLWMLTTIIRSEKGFSEIDGCVSEAKPKGINNMSKTKQTLDKIARVMHKRKGQAHWASYNASRNLGVEPHDWAAANPKASQKVVADLQKLDGKKGIFLKPKKTKKFPW